MRAKDQLKLETIYKIMKGEMARFDGQTFLGVSERTLRRYLKKYEDQGVAFLRHGNFRRAPVNRTEVELKLRVQKLIREEYFDFNILHLREKLQELGITITYSTLRRWCHEIHHVKQAKRRRARVRRCRDRMSQEGIMLQMDGSHHYWFGDRFMCLIAVIDDATNEVFARFYEGETTLACLDLLKELVRRKGIFKVLYTDKAGVFGGTKRENFSQVERAMGELGVQVLYAHSPESKGRVERLFRTLQDRLVPEMRINGITTMADANRYLETVYLPHHHNPRNMVQAHNPITAYRAVPAGMNLEDVFCMKEYRVVARDHTISVGGQKWMIADDLRHSIHKQKVEIRFDKWGHWSAYFAKKKLKMVKVKIAKKLAA
jgi:transposase